MVVVCVEDVPMPLLRNMLSNSVIPLRHTGFTVQVPYLYVHLYVKAYQVMPFSLCIYTAVVALESQ